MFIKELNRKRELKKDIDAWKHYQYEQSIDSELAYIVATATSFNKDDIIVWYANKNENKDFSLIKFQYKKKYYKLENNILTEIKSEDIFTI